jgi:ATP-dependent DNA helicase DinG
MFEIDTSEEAFMLSYIERHRDKKVYRYLFTFDKNYILNFSTLKYGYEP